MSLVLPIFLPRLPLKKQNLYPREFNRSSTSINSPPTPAENDQPYKEDNDAPGYESQYSNYEHS